MPYSSPHSSSNPAPLSLSSQVNIQTGNQPNTETSELNEPRYLCPVCVGLPMVKLHLHHGDQPLLLDSCHRCGGLWCDAGEVTKLRQLSPSSLEHRIPLTRKRTLTTCQSCHSLMERNVASCPSCGQRNQIACPVCSTEMERKVLSSQSGTTERYRGLVQFLRTKNQSTSDICTLDGCTKCRGVWFDAGEILDIWSSQAGLLVPLNQQRSAEETIPESPLAATPSNPAPSSDQTSSGQTLADEIVEIGLLSDPEGMVEAGGAIAQLSAEAIAQVPEIAAATVETTAITLEAASELVEGVLVVGEAAATLIEIIAAILGEL